MRIQEDIRDIAYIEHNDIVGLNFIRADGDYIFRRHYRQGLRSHIIEILDPGDVEAEKSGVTIDGTLHFPRARPLKILRIFRSRFTSLEEALAEIRRVKVTENYLTPEFIAQSTEIIVEYQGPGKSNPLLCGIQDYVNGVILDPWSLLKGSALLDHLYHSLTGVTPKPQMGREPWNRLVSKNCLRFVDNVRRMILQGRHVPDLAGIGNVLITPTGHLKLVDINNISKVVVDETIRLDDRNYPVCDKSIEALALIEEKLLDASPTLSDPVYSFFLTPERKEMVRAIEKKFIVTTVP